MKIKHFSHHQHLLILNENYDAREGDVCYLCNEQIVSCKSFVYSCSGDTAGSTSEGSESDEDSEDDWPNQVYNRRQKTDSLHYSDCAEILLHKSCAELPQSIQNPTNQKQFLHLRYTDETYEFSCDICDEICTYSYCSSDEGEGCLICLKCALLHVQSKEDRKFHHPAHNQHSLTLFQTPSSFICHACKVDNNNYKDLSYICTQCPFCMHKTCAHAPTSFQFQFHHKHPLILSFSLPQVYRKFNQHCSLCNKKIKLSLWLYYCPMCRFFAHFHCARSSRMLRSSSENEIYDSNCVHLPPADESSVNLLLEQFVKAMISSTLSHTNSVINHWAHGEHHLQLITINELNDDEILLLCDGCVKPIRTDHGDLFYGCIPCKYFLHKFCAELPKEIQHHLCPKEKLFAVQCSKPDEFIFCSGCNVYCNGIYYRPSPNSVQWNIRFHIGCATLPKMIKHEAHRHQLNLEDTGGWRSDPGEWECKACGEDNNRYIHRCEKCDFNICPGCILMAGTVKHRWDSHPLHLIYDPGMVSDHEHEYNCEFCSEEIDVNFWFYHCSDCDLSFHPTCFQESCYGDYPNIKFGATDIIIDKLHPHSLTFVLNKKHRHCEKCHSKTLGMPVLECGTCKVIVSCNSYGLSSEWCYLS